MIIGFLRVVVPFSDVTDAMVVEIILLGQVVTEKSQTDTNLVSTHE